MSGVYIKGMEMPKDYSVIVKIFPDGRVGAIPYVQWFKVDLIPETQAVPVPPHGRLIDAEAAKEFLKPVDGMRNYEPEWTWGELYESNCNVIDKLPTIIPAEEGE